MKIEDEIKGRFRNEYHKGLINLIFTEKQLSYQFLQILKKHRLTEPQYNVLRVLRGFRNEGPLSVGFIKDRMLDKQPDVSRIVDKLYEKGLVNRSENRSDRRQKDIEITEEGLNLLSGMNDFKLQEDQILKNLSLDEVIQFNSLLDKIRELNN
ncbi:MAG: MarR family transcriptional regulator [Bacteroidales bacterium]|nr:MarR family transcriptional regulator [Bacteroidales bacterium]MCF8391203.1 MarR family transcriptional regulator [Bacteroidales bacterium]